MADSYAIAKKHTDGTLAVFNTRTTAASVTYNDTTVQAALDGMAGQIEGGASNIPQPATNAPRASTSTTGTVGTSNAYAREDHSHPKQTTITGNAGTATKLATPRKINGVLFDGSADINIEATSSKVKVLTTGAVPTAEELADVPEQGLIIVYNADEIQGA